MLHRFRFGLSICIGAIAMLQTSGVVVRAQDPSPLPTLHASRARAEALIAAWNDRLPHVPGEVLVKFRAGADNEGRARALSMVRRGREELGVRWIGDVLVAESTTETNGEVLAAILARQPEVEWAQPNYWHELHSVPNDPSYSRQWNMDLIQMPRAWDINKGASSSLIVAVVDSGITSTTAAFAFQLWTGSRFESVSIPFRPSPDINPARISPGRDFIFWTGPVLDMVGHGTHVAGTVLEETNNNLGLAGIAHNATLLPLKACLGYWELQILVSARGIPGHVDPREGGGCDDASVAQAIRYAADSGAKVINLSIGGPQPTPVVFDALQYAVQKGAFVAIAVGNDYERGNPIEYPAAYAAQIDGVVAVGSVGRSSNRAFYSNTGTHVELVAPGGDSRDGGIAGEIYQMGLSEADFDPFSVIRPRFDRYVELAHQGTSMASPHVAGLAALLHSQGIRDPGAIEAAMKRFAKDLGTPGRDNEYGHGLIDARASLFGLGVVR